MKNVFDDATVLARPITVVTNDVTVISKRYATALASDVTALARPETVVTTACLDP